LETGRSHKELEMDFPFFWPRPSGHAHRKSFFFGLHSADGASSAAVSFMFKYSLKWNCLVPYDIPRTLQTSLKVRRLTSWMTFLHILQFFLTI
jgi:hypothetical protein